MDGAGGAGGGERGDGGQKRAKMIQQYFYFI
jgi:hypothetical protein